MSGRWDSPIEVAILPCLARGLSVGDEYLERTAPSFGLRYATPNDSKTRFIRLVRERTGVNLLSSKPELSSAGPGRGRARLRGPDRRGRPSLITDDQLVEPMDNATSGGQFAMVGLVHRNVLLGRLRAAVGHAWGYSAGHPTWERLNSDTFGGLPLRHFGTKLGTAPGGAPEFPAAARVRSRSDFDPMIRTSPSLTSTRCASARRWSRR